MSPPGRAEWYPQSGGSNDDERSSFEGNCKIDNLATTGTLNSSSGRHPRCHSWSIRTCPPFMTHFHMHEHFPSAFSHPCLINPVGILIQKGSEGRGTVSHGLLCGLHGDHMVVRTVSEGVGAHHYLLRRAESSSLTKMSPGLSPACFPPIVLSHSPRRHSSPLVRARETQSVHLRMNPNEFLSPKTCEISYHS